MGWINRLTNHDMISFLESLPYELAEYIYYFAPKLTEEFCLDYQDQLLAYLKRWQYELEGEYDDVV